MIKFIKGKYVANSNDSMVIENNGMGFLVKASSKTINHFNISEDIMIYTYMNVREDDISLFGFTTNEELSMFILLISVSGIGPKVAIGILEEHNPEQLIYAILKEDVSLLTKAKGIGNKTAQRVILELKDKIKNQDVAALDPIGNMHNDNKKEAIEALMALGYSKNDSVSVVVSSYNDNMTTEEIIRKALSNFVK